MPQPVTVYRWDDAGAPQLPTGSQPKPSEIIAILKACLIDGYGAKPALGWTMPFSDVPTHKYVFRNSPTDGSGGAVQMKDAGGGTDGTGAVIICEHGSSITGLDSIVNAGYIQSFSMPSYVNWKEWVLVGTTTGFYFMWNIDGAKTSGRNISTNDVIFCGDFESYIPSDNGRFICSINTPRVGNWSGETGSYSSSFTNSFTVANPYASAGSMHLIGADGQVDKAIYGLMVPSSPLTSTNTTYQFTGNDSGIYDRVYIGAVSITPGNYSILAPDGKSYQTSQVYPRIRGHLPGFVIETSPTWNSETAWPHIASKAGKNHIALPVTQQPNALWVNLEEW